MKEINWNNSKVKVYSSYEEFQNRPKKVKYRGKSKRINPNRVWMPELKIWKVQKEF